MSNNVPPSPDHGYVGPATPTNPQQARGILKGLVDALTNHGRNEPNCLSFNHDLLSKLVREAGDVLAATPTQRKWPINEREMAIGAAFGPVLKEAFPRASSAQRMAVCDALAAEVEKRADWFSVTSSLPALEEATIERCAAIADKIMKQEEEGVESRRRAYSAARYIAAAIRALPNAEKRHG